MGQALLYTLLKEWSEACLYLVQKALQRWEEGALRNEGKSEVSALFECHKRMGLYSLAVNVVAIVYDGAFGIRSLDFRAHGS